MCWRGASPWTAGVAGGAPSAARSPSSAPLTPAGEHLLLCPRCHARWPFDGGCPYCGNTATSELRTLTTADRVYRVTQCLKCDRYLKLLDSHVAGRPLLPFFDPVATLPLDAALMQES